MVSMSLKLHCSHFGLAVEGGLTLRLSLLFPPFSCLFQFPVSCVEDLFLTPFQFGLGRDVADSAVQPHGVVMLHVPSHDPAGILQGQGRLGADAVALDGLVEDRKSV